MTNYNILPLKLISLCNGLVFYAPAALLVRTSRGITVQQFFLLQAAMSVLILLLEVPCGMITDRVGYKKTIVISQILLLVARVQFLYAASFSVFLLEVVLEAAANCFISGTTSAYVYSVNGKDTYSSDMAGIDNWGTGGFIISTLMFPFLYQKGGLFILILGTVTATFLSVCAASGLAPEKPITEKRVRKPFDWSFIKDRKIVLMMVLNSCFSGAFIGINFFYVTKLKHVGLPVELMSPVIIGYSLLQLMLPRIMSKLERGKAKNILCLVMAGAGICFFGMYGVANQIAAVSFMLLIPSLVMASYYIISKIQNRYIDSIDQKDRRAMILSVFNMGNHGVNCIFLALNSMVVRESGIEIFLIIGILYVGISGLLYVKGDFLEGQSRHNGL